MGLRNAKPWTFRPKGLSDSIDGSSAFPGAMSVLQNLVPNPANADQWVPRPAAEQVFNFSGFTDPAQGTALLILGTVAWGMIASSRFPGKDEPFCLNLITGVFTPIANVTADNLPNSQPTTGDWTPPCMVASTNGRITITHVGYDGVTTFIGWIDLSSFVSDTIVGTFDGTTSVDNLSANVLQAGWTPGLMVAGLGVPDGTFIETIASDGLSMTISQAAAAPATITGTLHNNLLVDGLSTDVRTLGWVSGDGVSANGLQPGTRINVIAPDGLSFTITQAATAADTEVITLSGVLLTVTGGTPAAPVYDAGNTNGSPLPSVPLCAGVFFDRTYYGVGNFAVYSDTLQPQQVTNESQVLLLGDNTSITAFEGLPLTNQVTGGAVQALMVFKGAETIFQITGDEALSNLAQNQINGSVGTLAPNSICATTKGLAYIAPDGLRIMNFSGVVGDPIGIAGTGVNVPFKRPVNPTRMAAAFNNGAIRISVQPVGAEGQPNVEYIYDMNRNVWSGPHTFPLSIVKPYYGESADKCIGFAVGVNGALWKVATEPTPLSEFVENGQQLQCLYETVLLPDNDDMAGNAMVETNIAARLAPNQPLAISAVTEYDTILDSEVLVGPAPQDALWGAFVWGDAVWGGALSAETRWDEFEWGSAPWFGASGKFRQQNIPWSIPLVFKQMKLLASADASQGLVLGNVYLKYQILGYNLPPQS